jgi:TolB-like protein/DNA-binding winged helix-turn-helix (wHTH) protein
MLRIGEWRVDPASGMISRNGNSARLEARTLKLLLCLADRAGEVVSIDELLEQVWSGVSVTSDSVYQAVASLRRLLGDDSRQPAYIATVPKLGYRMVAKVGPWTEATRKPLPRIFIAMVIAAVVVLTLVAALRGRNTPPQKSIAVMPFLDLTEEMKHEEFADGMTEELIDKLSKVPGFNVPGPTSSFFFRGKRVQVGDVAKTLGVSYVLDGSVRKAGSRVRVAVRLIRAETGYVIWSEAYDRPFDDILMIQDDIAGEVTKALRTSI